MRDDYFTEKYEQYSADLYRIALVYLKNRADAEDAMQEALLIFFRKSPAFEYEKQEAAWLVRVVVNLCKNQLKKRKKCRPCDGAELDGVSSPQDFGETLDCVLKLPEKYRAVIHLYYYIGYSTAEIADILKISHSAVKMRLKRGREKLKSGLED